MHVEFASALESSCWLEGAKALGGDGAVDEATDEGGAEGVDGPDEEDSFVLTELLALVEELVLLTALKLDNSCSILFIKPNIHTDSSGLPFVELLI